MVTSDLLMTSVTGVTRCKVYIEPMVFGRSTLASSLDLKMKSKSSILLCSLFPCQPPSQFTETTPNFYFLFFNSEFFLASAPSCWLLVPLSPLIETGS